MCQQKLLTLFLSPSDGERVAARPGEGPRTTLGLHHFWKRAKPATSITLLEKVIRTMQQLQFALRRIEFGEKRDHHVLQSEVFDAPANPAY